MGRSRRHRSCDVPRNRFALEVDIPAAQTDHTQFIGRKQVEKHQHVGLLRNLVTIRTVVLSTRGSGQGAGCRRNARGMYSQSSSRNAS